MGTALQKFAHNDSYLRGVPDEEVKQMSHEAQKRFLVSQRDTACHNIARYNDILKSANVRERRGNRPDGMTQGRTMRKIGTIPFWLFANHPELASDDKALLNWMKKHPEFCSVPPTSI